MTRHRFKAAATVESLWSARHRADLESTGPFEWVMSATSLQLVKTLRDARQLYVYSPSLDDKEPANLMGWPIVIGDGYQNPHPIRLREVRQ